MDVALIEREVTSSEDLNVDVVNKYKMAAGIANDAVAKLVSLCLPGSDVTQLCKLGDQLVHEGLAAVFNRGQVEKGPAFPTCICVNNCAGNFSPMEDGMYILSEGDVVKISLGVQIDGYIGVSAHTHVVPTLSDEPFTGRPADAICAAHIASEAVLRLLRPGVSSRAITATIEKIAAAFNCTPVEDNFVCNMKRFVFEGPKVALNKTSEDVNPEEFIVEENDVYNVDIQISTGDGHVREVDTKPTVYQRDVTKQYLLRLKSSRTVYSFISEHFPTMPFTLRNLDPKEAALGLKECVNHDLVTPFAVKYEKDGETIAHFKFTVLVQEKGNTRLTSHPLPYVHSAYSVTDAELLSILEQPARVDGPKVALPIPANLGL